MSTLTLKINNDSAHYEGYFSNLIMPGNRDRKNIKGYHSYKSSRMVQKIVSPPFFFLSASDSEIIKI